MGLGRPYPVTRRHTLSAPVTMSVLDGALLEADLSYRRVYKKEDLQRSVTRQGGRGTRNAHVKRQFAEI
jgi:hypothetical protein